MRPGGTFKAPLQGPTPSRPHVKSGTQPDPPQGPTAYPTHTEGWTLGGRVLSQVRAVDAVPLDKLVSGGIGPEVVGRLHLGVLQRTGAHCRADRH